MSLDSHFDQNNKDIYKLNTQDLWNLKLQHNLLNQYNNLVYIINKNDQHYQEKINNLELSIQHMIHY